MPRPSRCRRICAEPRFDTFAPCGKAARESVQLTLDEYEAIRLVDHEKLTHEECARLMGISRTTVTEIYERARFKISDCIVCGKQLSIAGGNYRLCDGSIQHCCGKKCRRARQAAQTQKGESFMKIAVTYENGQVFQHFGRTAQFKVYDIEEGKTVASRVVDTNGSGHGALAGLLAGLDIDVLICGGIGAGAQNALAQAGIKLYGGVSGDADAAVASLLDGTLAYSSEANCDHHEHGEGHSCGSHGCGGASCGEEKHGCAGNH